MHFLVARAKRAGRAQTELTKELVNLLTDTLDNLKPLKAMGAQQEFMKFFDRRLHRLRRALRRQVVNREALRNGQDALLAVCMGVAAYLALVVLSTSLEQVVVVGVILSRTVSGFGRMQGLLQQAVVVESPFREVEELIAELAANQENSGGASAPHFEPRDPFRCASASPMALARCSTAPTWSSRPAASPCSPACRAPARRR